MQSHASYGRCGLGSDGTDRIVALVRDEARAAAARGEAPPLHGAKITGGGSGGAPAAAASCCCGSPCSNIWAVPPSHCIGVTTVAFQRHVNLFSALLPKGSPLALAPLLVLLERVGPSAALWSDPEAHSAVCSVIYQVCAYLQAVQSAAG